MGSFAGHVLPGTLFLLVGLWHIANCIVKFVSDPNSFKGRIWYSVPSIHGRFRYLELYIITAGAFIDLCIEFFYSTHGIFFVNGGLNTAHLNDFEHSAMLLMFFLYGLTALVNETRVVTLPDGALHIIVGMAFTAEYLLFNFHSTSHAGLEGRHHELLVILIGLCIILALLGAAFPDSFAVDLASGMMVTLQGLWFYQIAFTLYGSWMPAQCHMRPDGPACESSGFEIRGLSLADVQFSVMVAFLSVSVLIFYGIAAKKFGHHDLMFLASDFHNKDLELTNTAIS